MNELGKAVEKIVWQYNLAVLRIRIRLLALSAICLVDRMIGTYMTAWILANANR